MSFRSGRASGFSNGGGVADKIVGGWQVNGITSFQSGPPFTLATPGDTANIGSSAQRPNVVGDPMAGVSDDRLNRGVNAGTYWFNRAAFALPAQFTLGNVGKNTVFAPGLQNWDFSMFKNTSLSESVNLQLRGEFFNVFNHANFRRSGAHSESADLWRDQ
jgi:hypothetical protein